MASSYAGTGIFLTENEIYTKFSCEAEDVGKKIVKIHWEKYETGCESYVVRVNKDDKKMYFIGVLHELDPNFAMTGNTDVIPHGLLAAGIPSDMFQPIAFHQYSLSCKIIYQSCCKHGKDFLKELIDAGDEINTLELKLLSDEKEIYTYKCIYRDNSDGSYQIYKFTTEEPIGYMNEGIVSGGSETVVLMTSENYIYTIACGSFLRMKISDINPYDLPDIRRDGTPGTHITFAIQDYMLSLHDKGDERVSVVAKLTN